MEQRVRGNAVRRWGRWPVGWWAQWPAVATAAVLICLVTPWAAEAHKPEIVEDSTDLIRDPGLSQAFYDTLPGRPRSYVIDSRKPFHLYVSLLVPKSTNPRGRYSALIFRSQAGRVPVLLATLDGKAASWKVFWEEFGGDYYLQGPEFKRREPAGRYQIRVYSDSNRGKYVLAVGEREEFGPGDLLSAFTVLPALKTQFFGGSILGLLAGRIWQGLVAVALVGVVLLFGVWRLLTRRSRRRSHKQSSRRRSR